MSGEGGKNGGRRGGGVCGATKIDSPPTRHTETKVAAEGRQCLSKQTSANQAEGAKNTLESFALTQIHYLHFGERLMAEAFYRNVHTFTNFILHA